MNREEIIKWLESLKAEIGKSEHRPLWHYAEAIDMAIEALQAKIDGDLISRADAIEAIESRQTEQWIDADVDYNNGLESAIAEIKALPSAESVQGEWVDVENEPYCEYSVCGAYIDNLDDDYAFCPRCGADMRGEQDG